MEIKNEFSFSLPTIKSEEEWRSLLSSLWKNAEKFAIQVEQMPDKKLLEIFVHENTGITIGILMESLSTATITWDSYP